MISTSLSHAGSVNVPANFRIQIYTCIFLFVLWFDYYAPVLEESNWNTDLMDLHIDISSIHVTLGNLFRIGKMLMFGN